MKQVKGVQGRYEAVTRGLALVLGRQRGARQVQGRHKGSKLGMRQVQGVQGSHKASTRDAV